VKRLDGTDEEMANAALLTAKESFQAYFEGTVRNVSDSLSHPTLPSGVVVEWINGNPYISQDGGTTRPSYNTGTQTINV